MKAVQVEEISKSYSTKNSTVEALKDITLSVEEGEIYGLIGPDGAGKTTLFRILTTLLLADKGTASINNLDVVKDFKKIRASVGYMPGRFSLYQDLSVQENLEFFATIFDSSIQENYKLVKDIYVQLEPFKKRKAGQLSGGMKQKLALCCALIHKPEVLFLDEPTNGVDAVSRKEFWEMLHNLEQEGITILVSTAYMDEASLCDRIALIQKGQILSIDTPKGLTAQFKKQLWAVRASDMFRLLTRLKHNQDVESCYPFGQYLHVVFKSPQQSENTIVQMLSGDNFQGLEVREIEANIEDCFMELMKR